MIEELAVVALTVDLPQYHLKAGDMAQHDSFSAEALAFIIHYDIKYRMGRGVGGGGGGVSNNKAQSVIEQTTTQFHIYPIRRETIHESS